MPDPPVNGYQPGRADVGELCCPCFHRGVPAGDEDEEIADDAAEEAQA